MGEGSLLVVDEEHGIASEAEVDDVADPELDEELDMDLELVDSDREEEPRADPVTSASGVGQGFTAERQGERTG